MTSLVVHNYARALVELMKEESRLDFTLKLAELLIEHLKNRELTLFLRHPKIPSQDKKAFFQKLLPSETPQEINNFFNLIFDRRWHHLLPQILGTVLRFCILEQGYEVVTIISAKPLIDDEQDPIIRELESIWQIKIHPEFRINPVILGGIIIQRGDQLYDGSLLGRINEMKDSFNLMTNETGSKKDG